jgi:hypothetical protein
MTKLGETLKDMVEELKWRAMDKFVKRVTKVKYPLKRDKRGRYVKSK